MAVEEEGVEGRGDSAGRRLSASVAAQKACARIASQSVSAEEEKPVSQLRRPNMAARQLDTRCFRGGVAAVGCELSRGRASTLFFNYLFASNEKMMMVS